MDSIDLSLLAPILAEYAGVKGALITILQKTQETYGYLPRAAIQAISDRTGIAESEIIGVATFYTQFRLTPLGRHRILLCQGTACHVNSSERILAAVRETLGIEDGETTEDGLFTLECVACLGCCSLSPVMMIDDTAYGSLTPEKARQILNEYREAK